MLPACKVVQVMPFPNRYRQNGQGVPSSLSWRCGPVTKMSSGQDATGDSSSLRTSGQWPAMCQHKKESELPAKCWHALRTVPHLCKVANAKGYKVGGDTPLQWGTLRGPRIY